MSIIRTDRLFFLPALILLFVVSAGPAEAMNMKEGQWQLTTRMEIPGMPFPVPPMTFTQCLTEDNMVPQDDQQDQGSCTITDQRTVGNTYSYTMVCNSDGQRTEGKGSFTYEGTRMHGTMTINSDGMQMTTHYEGVWQGPCQ
ncbi:MAG: DUF3617 family protein [Desulfuromonadaceae bacterium]|nr:DUF3617 family protein [Desulfuromonadaceae bacterium]